MDTPAPSVEPSPQGLLAAEIRQSALLLGGALGLFGAFAVLLLMLTRLGS